MGERAAQVKHENHSIHFKLPNISASFVFHCQKVHEQFGGKGSEW